MQIKLIPYQIDILVSINSEFTAIFLLVYYTIISGYFYSFLDLFSTQAYWYQSRVKDIAAGKTHSNNSWATSGLKG